MERRGKVQQQVSPLVSGAFSESSITAGVVMGILLIWVAYLITILGETGETVYKASSIVSSLGTVFLTTMLVGGGIANARIDKTVRVGMVIMGAILLVGFFLSPALALLRYL